VTVAEFLRAVFEETDQGPVDVAEAEEAEVISVDVDSSRDLKVAATPLSG